MLRLFVWERFDKEIPEIICFALANNIEDAKKAVLKSAETPSIKEYLETAMHTIPLVVGSTAGFNVFNSLSPN